MQNPALLGAYIRRAREAHGWSLRDLAENAGISHTTVDNIEKGYDPRTMRETNITLDTLQKLAGALGISADALLSCYTGTAQVIFRKAIDTLPPDMQEDIRRERGGIREYLKLKWCDGYVVFPATGTPADEENAKRFLFGQTPPSDDEWQQILQFAAFLKDKKK